MALKASTGLRNQMLTSDAFKNIMESGGGCKLQIYEGTIPASANDAAQGTLILELTGNGDGSGLVFDTGATNGSLTKDPSQTWSGDVIASGTPSYYRLVAAGDSAGASSSAPRLQGSVDLAGADLNFSSLSFVAGATIDLDSYVVNLPTI